MPRYKDMRQGVNMKSFTVTCPLHRSPARPPRPPRAAVASLRPGRLVPARVSTLLTRHPSPGAPAPQTNQAVTIGPDPSGAIGTIIGPCPRVTQYAVTVNGANSLRDPPELYVPPPCRAAAVSCRRRVVPPRTCP